MLPTFVMLNPRSQINEFQAILIKQKHVDVAAISETWFTSKMPEEFLCIDGYTIFQMPWWRCSTVH